MISTLQVRRLPAAFVAGVWLLGTPIHARTADPEPTTYWYRLQDKDPLERVWEALRLYDDPENSVI